MAELMSCGFVGTAFDSSFADVTSAGLPKRLDVDPTAVLSVLKSDDCRADGLAGGAALLSAMLPNRDDRLLCSAGRGVDQMLVEVSSG